MSRVSQAAGRIAASFIALGNIIKTVAATIFSLITYPFAKIGNILGIYKPAEAAYSDQANVQQQSYLNSLLGRFVALFIPNNASAHSPAPPASASASVPANASSENAHTQGVESPVEEFIKEQELDIPPAIKRAATSGSELKLPVADSYAEDKPEETVDSTNVANKVKREESKDESTNTPKSPSVVTKSPLFGGTTETGHSQEASADKKNRGVTYSYSLKYAGLGLQSLSKKLFSKSTTGITSDNTNAAAPPTSTVAANEGAAKTKRSWWR